MVKLPDTALEGLRVTIYSETVQLRKCIFRSFHHSSTGDLAATLNFYCTRSDLASCITSRPRPRQPRESGHEDEVVF